MSENKHRFKTPVLIALKNPLGGFYGFRFKKGEEIDIAYLINTAREQFKNNYPNKADFWTNDHDKATVTSLISGRLITTVYL